MNCGLKGKLAHSYGTADKKAKYLQNIGLVDILVYDKQFSSQRSSRQLPWQLLENTISSTPNCLLTVGLIYDERV